MPAYPIKLCVKIYSMQTFIHCKCIHYPKHSFSLCLNSNVLQLQFWHSIGAVEVKWFNSTLFVAQSILCPIFHCIYCRVCKQFTMLLCIAKIRKFTQLHEQSVWKRLCAWRDFKNIFARPLFIIIFGPKMVEFHPYSILTG